MNEFEKAEQKRKKDIIFLENVLGNELVHLINDTSVLDIMLNQDSYIFVERFGVGMQKTNLKIPASKAIQIIELVASYNSNVVTAKSPIISATLPNGSRFEGVIGDVTNNNPIFSIRNHSNKIFTLEDYERNGVVTTKQKEFLINAIKKQKNILVVGGTGSGKTTFINACLQVLNNSDERLFILEDTRELQVSCINKNFLTTTYYVNMNSLLKTCMRMNPDRIIVGELRSGEVTLELLKAWNSGHSGGLSTIHANDALGGLHKLEQYLLEVTEANMSKLIATSIDIIVYLEKENNVRKVKEIKLLKEFDNNINDYVLKEIE